MKQVAFINSSEFLKINFRRLYNEAAQALKEGKRMMLVLSEPSKSREQEERYHAMIGDIAKQSTIHGKTISAESWKRLLVDAFKHDTKDDPDLRSEWEKFGTMQLMPALNHDGFVAVGEQTRAFSVKLASNFIEWLYAYGTETGVRFRA